MPLKESQPITDPAGWVDAHGEAMFAFARLRLGSAEVAEEAVQEALVAALQSHHRFEGRSSERTWLIGILRFKVIDQIRARGREMRNEAWLDDDRAHTTAHPCSLPPSELDEKEYHQALRQAVVGLPDRMRLAVVLREVAGLSTDRVCEILGVTPTNLWTLVHRAKARIRESLAHSSYGDP